MSREAARIVAAGNKIPPQAERKAARTHKNLPQATFCTSEQLLPGGEAAKLPRRLAAQKRHHSKIGKDYCYPSLNFAFVLL